MPKKLIPFDMLAEKGVPFSRRHVERLVASGAFPRPLKVGEGRGGRIAWHEDKIDEWIIDPAAWRARQKNRSDARVHR